MLNTSQQPEGYTAARHNQTSYDIYRKEHKYSHQVGKRLFLKKKKKKIRGSLIRHLLHSETQDF